MGAKLVALATAIVAGVVISTAQAAEPKHGGILKVYHRDNPPSLSIHEEATFSVNVPSMGLFNNLVIFDQHKPQNSIDTTSCRSSPQLGLEQRRTHLTFQLRRGREMARRPAVHGQGREMHLRPAERQGAGQVPQEPAQGVVRQRRGCHGQRRLRGDVPSQAAATVAAGDARLRLFADLSLPCPGGADAHASDRHRALQVRRVQAERSHQAREEPDYWKKGLPYLDGIEYTIIPDRATAVLAFVSGNFDLTFPTEMTAPL